MSDLVLRQDYWDDLEARRSFKDFLKLIHGLDLSLWESQGYWDYSYRPFSFFNRQGEVVSSVCVYSLDFVLEGQLCRAAQISGVGTLAEERRRGLNRQLTEIALEQILGDHEFIFLFSDDDAIPFYEATGFRAREEHRPHIRVQGRERCPGLRRLDLADRADRELAERFAAQRVAVSSTLGVLSTRLFMFHALYTMNTCTWHLPDLDQLVLFTEDGERLVIHDVVGKRVPTFDELAPYLIAPDTREVAFSFVPDELELEEIDWRPYPGNNLFDRGDLPLGGQPFLFPMTSHA